MTEKDLVINDLRREVEKLKVLCLEQLDLIDEQKHRIKELEDELRDARKREPYPWRNEQCTK